MEEDPWAQQFWVKLHVWQGALEEAEKGWLSGPFSLCEQLGSMFVVLRRLGLEQSDTIRAIDDMSESLVNSAYGSSYKLDLPGIDGISYFHHCENLAGSR